MPELLFPVELFMVLPVEPLEEPMPVPVPVPVVPELELPVLSWLVVPEGVVVLPEEPMEPEPVLPEPVVPVCACAVPATKAKEATKTAAMRLKEAVM